MTDKVSPTGRATNEPSPDGLGLPVGIPDAVQVFLDCDGVLADFDTYAEQYFGMPPREYEARMGSAVFWKELEERGDFYRRLPLMPDAPTLYAGVRHLSPIILTGCPRGGWAQQQKIDWAEEHFPGVPIITCRSADKRDHAKPGDVLIDDWHQHRHRWIEMGGVWITHTCAETSLAALWAHYPNLSAKAMEARQGRDEGSVHDSASHPLIVYLKTHWPEIVIEKHTMKPWKSITFEGSRNAITCSFPASCSFLDDMVDHEFNIEGIIVADVTLTSVATESDYVQATVEILVIHDSASREGSPEGGIDG